MVDFDDPNNWTEEYVRSHRRECLTLLKEDNLLVIHYVQENNYKACIAGLDRILNGLVTMQNSKCGDYRTHMSALSFAEGILLTFLGQQGIPTAIDLLKDAKDFAKKPETKKEIDSVLAPLQAGKPLDAEPGDVIELLQMVDHQLDKAISDSGTSPSCSVSALVSGSVDIEFEAWVEGNGWDEDDLERYYKKIRFRRNLYGLCFLLGPLGILILPFWIRAVHITKSIRYRSFAVKQSSLVFFVTMIFGLPTFYIYPWIMGKIIVATNWGMGMGDRRAWIPIIVIIVLVVGIVLVPAVARIFESKPNTTGFPAKTSEPPRTEPVNQAAMSTEEFEQILMGNWLSVRRDNNTLYFCYYDFPVEGETYIQPYILDNVHSAPFPGEEGDEYGWYTRPMGFPTFEGTYSLTVAGNNRFTFMVISDYFYYVLGEDLHAQHTIELTYVDDDTIQFDGETYIRSNNYTLAELAEIFSFDLEVEDTTDVIPEPPPTQTPTSTPTPGPTPMPTSSTIIASGDCGENVMWTLNSDGLLTISGTGPIEDYEAAYDTSPWYNYNDGITRAIIEDGVTSIGNHAFFGCYGLINVTIGNSVTSIGEYAFAFSGLTSVAIPDSVTSIGERAFTECRSLTSVTIGDGVTNIGGDAFYFCSSLTSVTIGNNVTSIGSRAFEETSLIEVTIPSSVTSIGYRQFAYCLSLTSVTIPASVTSIQWYAFSGCDGLTDIYYGGSESQWNQISDIEEANIPTNATIHYNS